MKLSLLMVFTVIFSVQMFVSCGDCSCANSDGNDEVVVSDADSNGVEQDVMAEEEPDLSDEDVVVEDDVDENVDESVDEGADDSDEIVCEIVTLGDLWVDTYSYGMEYTGEPGIQIGDASYADWIDIMFNSVDKEAERTDLEIGIYDLTTENNQDIFTCTECILVFKDFDDENGEPPPLAYFQETGTMEVTEIKAGTGQSKGIINARLVQIDMNMRQGQSNKIEGGSCLEFKNEPWNTFCTPDCTGQVCGDDGCYNECGECEDGFECNDDGTACDPVPTDDDVSDADVDM